MKQQTLTGDVLNRLPAPKPDLDDPVCKYYVNFRPECNPDAIEYEKVFIQDCKRDGKTAEQRAKDAAWDQTPFDIYMYVSVRKMEETDRTVEASDECRVD